MNVNKFLIQILSNEKMTPERKMNFMAGLSMMVLDYSILEVKGSIFFNVAGDFDMDVLHRFFSESIESHEIYLITELKGSVGTNIDEEVFLHFMAQKDLSGNTTISYENFSKPDDYENFLDLESFVESDEDLYTKRNELSVDDILDKILDKGIDSLTTEDKETLKNSK